MERNPTVRRKIEKQSNPKVMNLLEGKLTLKRFGFNEPSSGLLCFSIFLHTHTHTHTHTYIYIYI